MGEFLKGFAFQGRKDLVEVTRSADSRSSRSLGLCSWPPQMDGTVSVSTELLEKCGGFLHLEPIPLFQQVKKKENIRDKCSIDRSCLLLPTDSDGAPSNLRKIPPEQGVDLPPREKLAVPKKTGRLQLDELTERDLLTLVERSTDRRR